MGGEFAARGPGDTTGEEVVRPEGGIARGRWEAPGWAFVLVAAITVVALVAAGLRVGATWRRHRRK